jgi:hypothetical protein
LDMIKVSKFWYPQSSGFPSFFGVPQFKTMGCPQDNSALQFFVNHGWWRICPFWT